VETKQGLIGNVKKTIFGESTLKSFAKNCALPILHLDEEKPHASSCAGSGYKTEGTSG
jgi:hypothetical protein